MTEVWNDSVYPHGELRKLDERLWIATGSLPRNPIPRNMVVYRLEEGGLLIYSAVALQEEAMAELEALGAPEIMVVPNGMHRFDAARYRERYPELQVICPRAAREKVEEEVPVDAVAEEALEAMEGVGWHPLAGAKLGELVFELKLAEGKALVFCDVLFNLDHLPGFGGWMLRLMGSSGFFGVTRVGRWFFTKDKAALKKRLEELAAIPDLSAIVVAHGDPIEEDCARRLREAAARL